MARAVVTEDYYSVLGVSQSATSAVIREAYKKCALKYHPDKNLDNREETTAAFQQLVVAWETLKDTTKRALGGLLKTVNPLAEDKRHFRSKLPESREHDSGRLPLGMTT
jgi:curved DNA-binding protein CbpA